MKINAIDGLGYQAAPLMFDPDCGGLVPPCGGDATSGMHPQTGTVLIVPDRDEYDSPAGTRGEFIRILLDCESCEGVHALTIGNHKGTLHVDLHDVEGAENQLYAAQEAWLADQEQERKWEQTAPTDPAPAWDGEAYTPAWGEL